MSFPRYQKYKDSGVEWLGAVPEHWEVTQLKRVVNPDRQITYGIVQAGPHVPDGVPYIRPADMTDEQGVAAPDEVMRTSLEIVSAYSRSTIRTGDLVCSIGPSFGKVMITPEWLDGANLTQGTARIAVQPPHDARYLFWTLRSTLSVAQWESSVGGATFRALNLGPLAETTIPVPSVTEQTAIATFLDRETGKIDELVAEQRRLMELLKEKRQAVISHAVTRGLNPDVPLKPSGFEWLGDVPEHWSVIQLKRVCRIESGHTPQKSNEAYWVPDDCCIPWISLNDTKVLAASDFIDETEVSITALGMHNSSAHLIESGAVVMNRDGARVGLSAITTKPMCVSQHIIAWVCGASVFNHYLLHVLYAMNDEIYRLAGGATIPTIGMPDIREMTMPLPPLGEQNAIVDYLIDQRHRLDTLTAEAQRAIDLLQERRTALISAAVTGQIDVRRLTTP